VPLAFELAPLFRASIFWYSRGQELSSFVAENMQHCKHLGAVSDKKIEILHGTRHARGVKGVQY